ncbi:hypothetical protein [Paenibacillus sp. S28]|uniref:hypothetical protein n=1 Tax=Paenibacillus sp. S28 TaxID=2767463 RepID=UPI00190CCF73|nr:hypothetical protein [Paenibacillus sp. S28]MBJ9990492.1 hypothetical protein [Paenibacillus sp. S28]
MFIVWQSAVVALAGILLLRDQRPQVDFSDDGWGLEKILKANFPQMLVPESSEERYMFREVIDNADQPIVQDRLH